MGKIKLGQVFLQNSSIVQRIIDELNPSQNEIIIEIGPGKGVITDSLAGTNCKLTAIELDKYLYEKLLKKFSQYPNLKFINADILKTSLSDIVNSIPQNEVKIVSNIPYYITSPILEYLVNNRNLYQFAIIMMQYEVGERILAYPDSKKFGALTLFIQYYMEVKKIIEIPKEDFFPVPEVNSIILKISPRKEPRVKVEDESLFFKVISFAFQKRRKMLHNALALIETLGENIKIENILDEVNIKHSVRPENLSIEDYAQISNIIFEKMKK